MSFNCLSRFLFCIFLLFYNIRISGQTSGTDHIKLQADSLIQKAKELQEKTEFTEAIFFLEKAQVIYKKTENWEDYVTTFITIFDYLAGYADMPTRLYTIDQTLLNAEKYLSKDHPLKVEALWKKGEIYIALGKLDSAIYFTRA